MPANLTPEYLEAERRYREAETTPDKILALERMLAVIPKHKGTEKLQADIKRRISKLKGKAQKKSHKGKTANIYHVEKVGAAQVVLVGPPNTGKSTILAKVTNSNPEIADYLYTTRLPMPGMMQFENIQIELVDLPPISEDFMETWVSEIVRNADGVLLVLDLSREDLLEQVETTLEKLEERKIKLLRNPVQRFLEGGVACKRTLILGNKSDGESSSGNYDVLKDLYSDRFHIICVSAKEENNIEEMKREIFNMLGILRAYTKAPGKKPDMDDPVILKKGSTVLDFATEIHKDFAQNLKFAKIWGSEKYDGQMVNKDYILNDGDIIELHI